MPAGAPGAPHQFGRVAQAFQPGSHPLDCGSRDLGRLEAVGSPDQQRAPDRFLELADLLSDGGGSLAELITGRVALSTRQEMLAEIELMRSWKRSWMPFSSARSARVLLHMAHYHDELLRGEAPLPAGYLGRLSARAAAVRRAPSMTQAG